MKKKFRVKKSEEIKAIMQNKQYVVCNAFSLYVKPRNQEHARVAISVSKKLGKAHVRNKIKRQVRMMIQSIYQFDEAFDTVILVRLNYLTASYAENLTLLQNAYLKVRKKIS